MNLAYLMNRLPSIRDWINDTLTQHAAQARPVDALNFHRLQFYFPPALRSSAKVVMVNEVPKPPLSSLGLPEFGEFEKQSFAGITFNDTYFIRSSDFTDEAIHFHELVHVIQWNYLGVDKFLIVYALGLLEHGYHNSPLEVMAYKHQQRFSSENSSYAVQQAVHAELDALLPSILDKAFRGGL